MSAKKLSRDPAGFRDFENLSRAVPCRGIARDTAGSRGIGLPIWNTVYKGLPFINCLQRSSVYQLCLVGKGCWMIKSFDSTQLSGGHYGHFKIFLRIFLDEKMIFFQKNVVNFRIFEPHTKYAKTRPMLFLTVFRLYNKKWLSSK